MDICSKIDFLEINFQFHSPSCAALQNAKKFIASKWKSFTHNMHAWFLSLQFSNIFACSKFVYVNLQKILPSSTHSTYVCVCWKLKFLEMSFLSPASSVSEFLHSDSHHSTPRISKSINLIKFDVIAGNLNSCWNEIFMKETNFKSNNEAIYAEKLLCLRIDLLENSRMRMEETKYNCDMKI